jgi:hypothetical protein
MLMQILLHTPPWVFALFAALVAFGLLQLRSRRVGFTGVAALPLAMVVWSLFGTIAAFGPRPTVLLAWVLGLALSAGLVLSRPVPAGAAYDAASRRFAVPGSAWPLVLMMAIFFAKFATGAAAAINPALAADPLFATAFAALYGTLSGAFVGRAARLWRLLAPTIGPRPALRVGGQA